MTRQQQTPMVFKPEQPKRNRSTYMTEIRSLIAQADLDANYAQDMYDYHVELITLREQQANRRHPVADVDLERRISAKKDESPYLKKWAGKYDFAQKQIMRYTNQLIADQFRLRDEG